LTVVVEAVMIIAKEINRCGILWSCARAIAIAGDRVTWTENS